MMADADELAQQALTAEELAEAAKMGYRVSTCVSCKRPTLSMPSDYRPVAPITCGRQKCIEAHVEGLQ